MLKRIKMFDYFEPKSVEEAIKILKETGNSKVIAGGTDLIVQMKTRNLPVSAIINLKMLKEFSFIKFEEGGIRIGALTPISKILNSKLVIHKYIPLIQACNLLGSVQVRNRATIGGNLCNASPAAETAAPLLIFNTQVSIMGGEGVRTVLLKDFFRGPGETVLKNGEILTDLFIPDPPAGAYGQYIKYSPRRAMEICIAGIAVIVVLTEKNYIKDIRIGLNSLSPTPVRANKTEEFLKGRLLDNQVIEDSGKVIIKEINPISDIRASAEYRIELAARMLLRILKNTLNQ